MTGKRPTANSQLNEMLARFPGPMEALAKRCLLELRRAYPGTMQLVYDYRKSVVVALGMSEQGHEALVALAVHADRVQLYFPRDTHDPLRLLKGSGTKVRSVTLKSMVELKGEGVANLIREGSRTAERSQRGKGTGGGKGGRKTAARKRSVIKPRSRRKPHAQKR